MKFEEEGAQSLPLHSYFIFAYNNTSKEEESLVELRPVNPRDCDMAFGPD